MSKLVANVYVEGVGYGPAHGNEANVPADVVKQITNPAAWDTAPDGAADPPPVPTVADLDAVAEDKDALLAFRDAHDLDVDGRLGVDKLRDALRDAIG